MFIEGKVTPPISNVVVVINTKESNLGEATTITVRTDADGKYRLELSLNRFDLVRE